ncbi:zinc finger BED domain-containing protein 4-like [Pseudorasbora parva]|uniref:zinc finger BED domain-containing protein 4-like n=2 Tax=Pseudorasbora parva TaxID=51549 RepID=UPI00351DC125
MSAVWKHFKVSEKDAKTAVCKHCSAELSRGGASAKTYSTSSLIYHLKSRHPEHHAEYEKDAAAAAATAAAKRKVPPPSLTHTPSVADFLEKAKKFTSDSAKAKGITKKIMEFIALDDQPFSVVEDVGFRRLIDHIEPVTPCQVDDIAALSFTTDIWSSDVSPTSMLSLTVQWIDTDFKLKKIVLHSQEFRGSHTAVAISEAFANMFDTWRIDRSKVHAVVSDNARNMAKAMEDSNLKGIRCMAHTIQLAVNEGLLSQRSIADVIAIGRKIVGHFKHSPLAYARLQSIQEQFGMPQKRFQQDVSTRWNSTYYMLESLFAQKRVLATYIADHDLPATFTAYQWVLIENVLSLLAPFEQITKEISSSDASVADIIPLLAALKRLLNKEAETDHGVKTTKSALLEAVSTRFSQADSEPLYCIATVLDPRYKDHYLDEGKKLHTREMIQAELDLGKPLGDGDGQVMHSAGDENSAESKRARTADEPRTVSLSDMFDEILQENTPFGRQRTSSTAQQLDSYLSEVPIPRSNNPLEFWRTNQGRFPDLAQMARRYLSAPCTSTDSERLFSAASHIIDEKRNRLSCEKAEKLLFIKKNLPLFLKK